MSERTYKLHEQKIEGITEIPVDDFNRIKRSYQDMVAMHYSPSDVDYQNVAISVTRYLGMNVADNERKIASDSELAVTCAEFGIGRYAGKDAKNICDYEKRYLGQLSQLTGESPLTLVDKQIKDIQSGMGQTGRSEDYSEAVKAYMMNDLGYGKPAYLIKAEMDAITIQNAQTSMSFADAVANIPVNGQGMER